MFIRFCFGSWGCGLRMRRNSVGRRKSFVATIGEGASEDIFENCTFSSRLSMVHAKSLSSAVIRDVL